MKTLKSMIDYHDKQEKKHQQLAMKSKLGSRKFKEHAAKREYHAEVWHDMKDGRSPLTKFQMKQIYQRAVKRNK